MKKRISNHDLFIEIAESVSKRSTCCRLNVWCVIVKDWMIIWTWYNWVCKWEVHCIDKEWWCSLVDWHCTAIHSEENAIINCAFNWISTNWADIYCTHIPCDKCTMRLINAGVKNIYYKNEYRTWEKKFKSNLINVFQIYQDDYLTEQEELCKWLF